MSKAGTGTVPVVSYLFLIAASLADDMGALREGRGRSSRELERIPFKLMSPLSNPQEFIDDESVEDGQDDDWSNPYQYLTDHDVGLEEEAGTVVFSFLGKIEIRLLL